MVNFDGWINLYYKIRLCLLSPNGFIEVDMIYHCSKSKYRPINKYIVIEKKIGKICD